MIERIDNASFLEVLIIGAFIFLLIAAFTNRKKRNTLPAHKDKI